MFLTMTILWERERLPALSLITALSVIEAIGPRDSIKIKWPNDILANVQKAGGILIEYDGEHAIIGIGINTAIRPPPGIIPYPTTSLAAEGISIEPIDLANIIAARLLENIILSSPEVVERMRPHMYKIGKRIFVLSQGKMLEGRFDDLAPNGALILDGRQIISGELTKENF